MASNLTVTEKAVIARGVLNRKLPFTEFVKAEFSKEFGQGDGDFVKVTVPKFPTASKGKTAVVNTLGDKSFPLSVEINSVTNTVDINERTLEIKDWKAQVADPAMASLAEQISQDVYNTMLLNAEQAEVATTASFDHLSLLAAQIRDTKVNEHAVGGAFISNALASKVIASGSKWIESGLSKELYDGNINEFDGFNYIKTSIARPILVDWIPSPGATVTSVAAGADQTSILTIDTSATTSADTAVAGTVFRVADCNIVNIFGDDLGMQRSFIVLEDAVGGDGTIDIKVGEIITSGAGKNTSIASLDTKAVTSPMESGEKYLSAVLCAKDSVAIASKTPAAAESANSGTASVGEGVNVRISYDYSNSDTSETVRYDTMFGVRAIYPKATAAYFVKI